MDTLSVVTYNARGLRERKKRRIVFRHLHVKYANHIVILQETHSTPDVETIWQNEWGSTIIFSHGTVQQAGVAILMPRSYRGTIRDKFTCTEGRITAVRLEIDSCQIALIGIYGPAVDNQEIKLAFFEKVHNILTEYNDTNLIFGGDLNVHLSPYDVEENKFKETSVSAKISEMMEEFCLIDIWRKQNPRVRNFTWRRLNPLTQSRLDYIFVSAACQVAFDIRADISTGIKSDHSMVDIVAKCVEKRRGPGLWRYNNSLHESDPTFVKLVRQEIVLAKDMMQPYTAGIPIGVIIEMLLSNIRVISIRRSKTIAFELRKEETELLEKVTEMEKDLSLLEEPQKNAYAEAKNRLDAIKTRRGIHAIMASGVKWVEEGEKVTRYFLNRGKQLSAMKTITKINDDSNVIVEDKAILQYCSDYYRKTFSAAGVNKEKMRQFLSHDKIPKLARAERNQCEGAITNDECKLALSAMNKNKAPGVTGFTSEFFMFFWSDIGDLVTRYVNDAYTNDFFVTQKRGIITLIPKKDDQELLQNKRPICLLDVIYKIVAKVMANRLAKVIHKLVAPEQTGFIKGRFIGDNLRLISDIIEYCELDQIEGILMACDYRAAFDSLEHEFLFAALEAYNFGESFIQWVKLLYHGAQLSVTNNGYTSPWFLCERGTFQGSPISGMLFVLAIEILAINVRCNQNIGGIKISNVEIKLSLYADDITAFIRDQESAEQFFSVMDDFCLASGLSLNMQKSHIMWLGKSKHRKDPIRNIKASKIVKVLGIYFSAVESCVAKNVDPACKKIEGVINIWSQRALTIKGRITVCKTLISSQLVYLGSCVQIPNRNIAVLQSKIMRFLWRGRPPKVAHRILCQKIEDGGLNATNLALLGKSLRLAWIRRIFVSEASIWRRILQNRIGKYKITDLIQTSFGTDDIKRFKIPVFYKELLKDFQVYSCHPIDPKINIQPERLWYNRSIRSGGKTMFINGMYQAGIITVNDLTREDGNIMPLRELKRIAPTVSVDMLTYARLIRGIPRLWKEKLATGGYNKITDESQRCHAFFNRAKAIKNT